MNTDRFRFRAYDALVDKILYPGDGYTDTVLFSYVTKTGQLDSVRIGESNHDWEVNGYSAYEPSKDLVLMQCTGIKDSKGLLIYEGDIICIDDHELRRSRTVYQVIWDEQNLSFFCIGNDGDDYGSYTKHLGIRCERDKKRIIQVIGNIHQNSSLFKK